MVFVSITAGPVLDSLGKSTASCLAPAKGAAGSGGVWGLAGLPSWMTITKPAIRLSTPRPNTPHNTR